MCAIRHVVLPLKSLYENPCRAQQYYRSATHETRVMWTVVRTTQQQCSGVLLSHDTRRMLCTALCFELLLFEVYRIMLPYRL